MTVTLSNLLEPIPGQQLGDAANTDIATSKEAANDTQAPAANQSVPRPRHTKRLDQRSFPDTPRPTAILTPTTIENVDYMLRQAGISARYNDIKKKLEITIPGHTGTADNRDNATMTAITSMASRNGMAVGLIPQYVEAVGDRYAFNPVADWIYSKPWDGLDRVQPFIDTVTAREGYPPALKAVLLKKWLLSAVAAAVMPSGFRNRGVLTLQGPQGIGKTSWALSLVSDLALREQCVKVDHHLDSSNKDSILGAISHWIVELGELDSSFKKDIARLKGFLTSTSDKVRRPYARVDSEYQRRTVFIATVNESNFLVDTTGNSRWWTIAVDKLNFNHGIDMQQVYAQLAVEFNDGAIWWLTAEEEAELALVNAPHQSVSVVRELLLGHIDLSLGDRADKPALTCTDLLVLLGIEKPTNAQAKECGTVLREFLGPPKRINGRDKWRIPCTVIEGVPRRLRPVLGHDEDSPVVTALPPLGPSSGAPQVQP